MGIVSRALVERLAGHRGMGESSRRAELSLAERDASRARVEALSAYREKVRLALRVGWSVAHAQSLGDDTYALTLIAGERDATAIVGWVRRGDVLDLVCEQCTDEDAELWLTSLAGGYSEACNAVVRAR